MAQSINTSYAVIVLGDHGTLEVDDLAVKAAEQGAVISESFSFEPGEPASSDDLAALEATHSGGFGRAARWNDFARGMGAIRSGAEDTDGAKIGLVPNTMNANWDHEALYHGFYRFWKERMIEGSRS